MALACPHPATLFSVAIGSRASAGLGAGSVAGLLQHVLRLKPLELLDFSLLQHLQRLQRPLPSHTHAHRRRAASGRDHARGFGGVASVASVAERECIYKSITCAATPSATPRGCAGEGVAAPALILPAAAPQGSKYPRLFKGLGAASLGSAETGRNGVLSARAPASRRAASRADRLGLDGRDQAQTGRFRPSSPVPASPFQRKSEQSQSLRPILRLTICAKRGAASRQNGPPRPPADPTPRPLPAPSSAARFAAPAAGPAVFPAGSGEKAERSDSGARGSGAPGFRAAKTAGQRSSGSGEPRHG